MIIKKDPDTIRSYLEDSSNIRGGHADELAIPEDANELSSLLKDANSKKIPVTISGGGTGTTGSRIPFGGMVVSMEKFNKIIDLSKEKMRVVAQAAVLVEEIKCAAEGEGLFYTSHPTEKTASAGGTVATNASGSRSFKYGPTRRYVNRLKMVLPNGEILELKRGEKIITRKDPRLKLDSGIVINIPLPDYKIPDVKNSAGYFAKDGMDLTDLFIGQEGTLSVITEVEFKLVKKPPKILSSFVFFRNEEDSLEFSAEARKTDALSLEYFDAGALELLRRRTPNVPKDAKAAVFFEQETSESGEELSFQKWLKLISAHEGSLDDTWVAMNEKAAAGFTEFRHYVPEAVNEIVRKNGFPKLSTDIAVPPGSFPEMAKFYTDTFKEDRIGHVIFGHIGECHLHVNLLPKREEELVRSKDICLSFVRKGVSLGGTISAEHGVGKSRHEYLEIMYGRQGILEMAGIKKAFDPNCILGLDNIFPREVLGLV